MAMWLCDKFQNIFKKLGTRNLQKVQQFEDRLPKNIFLFKTVPGIFLIFFRCSGVSRDKSWGLVMGSKTKKSWNLEFWASQIMKSGFYYTDREQKKLIKLLKVVLKYIFAIN